MEHLISSNSSTDLRSDAHQSQIIGGDAGEDHTQIVGGDTVKLLGGIYPPRVSAPLLAKLELIVLPKTSWLWSNNSYYLFNLTGQLVER